MRALNYNLKLVEFMIFHFFFSILNYFTFTFHSRKPKVLNHIPMNILMLLRCKKNGVHGFHKEPRILIRHNTKLSIGIKQLRWSYTSTTLDSILFVSMSVDITRSECI